MAQNPQKPPPPLSGLVHKIHNWSRDLMKICGKVNQSNIKALQSFITIWYVEQVL